ncbi:hypothetical protein [Cellulomonas sp. ICMP 17802]|uniref:hypothetical protein n=1 Tax=Cellulomonas sp. ICMP 17802 TaxID=3239199 RepID=UPI00351B56A0
MTRELSDLMADALVAQERAIAGIAPASAAFARTVRRVKHRRLVRHSVESTLAVAAIAGLATAGWIGSRYTPTPPPPAQTPSPTMVTPTPSPTPTPTATPIPLTAPGMPPSLPLPAGLPAATTPGWVLVTYRPAAEDGTVAGQYVLLVSPHGDRYLVADLTSSSELRILWWRAGATNARVTVGGAPATLDLGTGSVTPDPRQLPGVYVATVADGTEVWTVPVQGPGSPDTYAVPVDGDARAIPGLGSSSSPVSLSPDRRLVASDTASADAVVVVDPVAGTRVEIPYGQPNAQCSTVAWIDATGVLAQCFDFTGGGGPLDWNPRLVRADLDGTVTVVRQQVEGDPFTSAGAGAFVSDGIAALSGVPLTPGLATANACPEGVYLTDGTPVQRATASYRVAAVGGTVYVAATPGCEAATLPTELTVHGADGGSLVLAPVPPGGRWTTGLTSWLVGE